MTGSSPRGRPRRAETDRRIRAAAAALLREGGPSAVTVEGVAARSGAARTTVYRRYQDRDELLAAVLDDVVEAGLPDADLPVTDKLRWLLQRVLDALEDGIGRGGTAALLTDSDPAFTQALRDRLAAHLSLLAEEMARDVEAGRLDPGVDPDTLVGLLVGAYLAEVVRYGDPRPGWADRTVALLEPAVVPRGPRSGRMAARARTTRPPGL